VIVVVCTQVLVVFVVKEMYNKYEVIIYYTVYSTLRWELFSILQ